MKTRTITSIMLMLILVGMLNVLVVGAAFTVESIEWLPPLTRHEEFAFTDGSTLPIKFRLLDAAGSFVMDPTVEVTVNEILFSDSFDDVNYPGWSPSEPPICWSVTSGVLHNDGSLDFPRILADSTMSFTDYIFEADARLLYGEGNYEGGYALLFRVEHENWEFYSFQYDMGDSGLKLYRFVEDTIWPPSGYELAFVDFTIEYDTWHHLKVQVVGTHIQCYVDGIKVFDVTDTAAPLTGGIGLRTWHASAEFDNVVVLGVPEWESFSYADGTIDVSESIYHCNLHTRELGMPPGDYMITVWLDDEPVQVGSHPFKLVEPGKGRGKP